METEWLPGMAGRGGKAAISEATVHMCDTAQDASHIFICKLMLAKKPYPSRIEFIYIKYLE